MLCQVTHYGDTYWRATCPALKLFHKHFQDQALAYCEHLKFRLAQLGGQLPEEPRPTHMQLQVIDMTDAGIATSLTAAALPCLLLLSHGGREPG